MSYRWSPETGDQPPALAALLEYMSYLKRAWSLYEIIPY